MFVEQREGPNLRLNCQFLRKRNVHIYITVLCQFKCCKYYFQGYNRGKISRFSGCRDSPRPMNCIWDKPNLLANISPCSDSSQYAIFSQKLVNADFFYFWKRPRYSDEKVWKLIHIPYLGSLGFALGFAFQSGALL